MATLHQPTAEPLKVMSYNIRYGTANDGEDRWELRSGRTIEMIRRHRSHVMGVQEALHFQIETLLQVMPGYASVGVGRDDGRRRGEFTAVLYDSKRLKLLRSDTFWLSDTPNVPGSKTWGNQVTRICTWAFFEDLSSGRHFYFYNVHLDHESQPSREKSVSLLLNRIKGRSTEDPVVVTGDFNVGESNPAIAAMRSGGFVDTFRVKHPDERMVGTFNAFKEWGTDKIDYIFADSSWKVLDAEIAHDKVDGRFPSDHAPVVASLVGSS